MVCLGLAVATVLQHEIQGRTQTADDGDESEDHKVHHAADYPVSPAPRAARFWLLTVAAILGVLITLALGFWQLSRAAEKLALQKLIDDRQKLAVLDSLAPANDAAGVDLLYRIARLRGTWMVRHTVFLDNRQMNGRPGFFVLTPLRLESSGTAVVVQRGWVPRSFIDRAQVPAVSTPAGPVEITGRIAPPPSKLYEFQESGNGTIRQNLNVSGFSREIGVPVAAVSVLQLGPPDDGLARNWPRVNTGVEKHHGYAFQWFALSGLIAILYGWFQIVRRFKSPR